MKVINCQSQSITQDSCDKVYGKNYGPKITLDPITASPNCYVCPPKILGINEIFRVLFEFVAITNYSHKVSFG